MLVEKGGMTKERLVNFLEEFLFDKYKNNLIILDNAGSHRNNYVKDAITESGNKEQYIDELKSYSKIKNKNIVAIDPNMSDLLYCVDGDNKERNFFRYTQNQRRKETKHKKYRNIILQLKDKKVIELETELSKYNRKTLEYNEFKKYIQKKNEVNIKLFKFYENYIFRKLYF